MRVLMMTHNMAGLGGSFMRAYSLARPLVQLGVEVTLIASRRKPGLGTLSQDWHGVRVVQTADILPEKLRHGGLSPLDGLGRLRLALAGPFDLVHGFDHRFAVSLPAFSQRRLGGAPYISDWSDLWGRDGIAGQRSPLARLTLGQVDHFWEQWTRRRADAVTAITHDLAGRALALGVREDRVWVAPLAANLENIRPLPKAAARQKLGLQPEAPVLVHSGFSPYDMTLLGEMFVCLARSRPEAMLVTTGGRFPEMEQVIAAAGLSGQARYLGVVPYGQLQEVLACGDVMLLPYRDCSLNRARYPNRFGDYLAAGRPVVTNPTGDLGRLMRRRPVGLLVDESPEAFASGVEALLDHPEMAAEMGREARCLAETELNSLEIARALVGFYTGLVSGAGRRSRV